MKLALVVVVALLGCEKATPDQRFESGALTRNESDLLAHLPAGASVVMGGSFYHLQKRLSESSIGKLSAQMSPPELTAWNDCLAAKPLEMAGTGTVGGGEVSMRVFMRGVTLAEMASCARSAGLPVTTDPDGQFVTIESTTRGYTAHMPYLATGGGLYGMISMDNLGGGAPTLTPVTRAELEREVASLAQGTAADDPGLAALLPRIDRRKMMWFAGSAAGTPFADKVELGYGSFSIERGVSIDVTIKPTRDADADAMLAKFRQAKSRLNNIPVGMAVLKDAVRAIKIAKVADGVRVQLSLTDEQIDEIATTVGPMMGGLRP